MKYIFPAIGLALVGAVIGVFAGGILTLFAGGVGVLPGAIIGGILLPTILGVSAAVEDAKERKKRARWAELADRQARESRANERQSLANQVIQNAGSSLDALAKLPSLFGQANQFSARARGYFSDGAFSPFWSAIEGAYGALGQYRAKLNLSATAARRHPDLIAWLIAAGGDPEQFVEFPSTVDTAKLYRDLDLASNELGKQVYEAQKKPTFAQIWEQRRTTAAVIAGFSNLENAVDRMGYALRDSIQDLEQAVTHSIDQSKVELSRVSAEAVAVGRENAAQMKALNVRAAHIRNDVHKQVWGHLPLTDR